MTKVLLVEDDNNLREIYEARLAAEGYEISTAKDGEDALAVAKKVKPDLIISDVMMPRISGFEMLDILRNTEGLKHTKIIMLTALGQAEDKSRADSLGADRYLVKSQVTLEDIVKAAQELLDPDAETTTADNTGVVSEPAPAAAPQPTPDTANPAPTTQPETPPMPTPITTETEQQPAPAPAQPAPATPVNPAIQPTPVATPPENTNEDKSEPLIQMPPQPVDAAAATVDQAQSTSQENATVTQQIQNFVNTVPASPAPAAQSETATTPPAESEASTSDNDAVIQAAIDNLSDTTASAQSTAPTAQEPTTQPETSADTATDTANEQPSTASTSKISGEKVIQPINDLSQDKNDIQTLLAQEQMKESQAAATAGTPVVGGGEAESTGQNQPTPSNAGPAHPPGGVFMPNENGSANENAL